MPFNPSDQSFSAITCTSTWARYGIMFDNLFNVNWEKIGRWNVNGYIGLGQVLRGDEKIFKASLTIRFPKESRYVGDREFILHLHLSEGLQELGKQNNVIFKVDCTGEWEIDEENPRESDWLLCSEISIKGELKANQLETLIDALRLMVQDWVSLMVEPSVEIKQARVVERLE